MKYSSMELVLFEKLPNIKLSRSVFRVTTFLQFDSTKFSLNLLLQYTQDLEENIKTLFTKLVTDNHCQKTYDTGQQNVIYASLLTSCSNKLNNSKCQIIYLHTQLCEIFNTLNQLNHSHTKCGIIHSLFNFLFDTTNSTEEITAIKNNMEILKGNQDILSNQIRHTFNFVNITYMETNTNRLLLNSLQKDIVHTNATVHHLSKEVNALIYNRIFFIITFQLRSHLGTLHNGINSLKIDSLSIIYQISVLSSQNLTQSLLNPLDLMSLLIKNRNQVGFTSQVNSVCLSW